MLNQHRVDGAMCAIAAIIGLLVLMPGHSFAQNALDTKTAVRTVVGEIVDLTPNDVPSPSGARIHLYGEVLDPGTVVHPFQPAGRDKSTITCSGRCLLFFVDWYPAAHFAHPVTIALWDQPDDGEDGGGGSLRWIQARWWPVIRNLGSDGDFENGFSVFNTFASRAYPEERSRMDGATDKDQQGTIVFDASPRKVPHDPSRVIQIRPAPDGSLADVPSKGEHGEVDSQRKSLTVDSKAGCSVWAVVVDGDTDKTDTFDEDAFGMYTVLRGHKVPKNQIYYLSPHMDAPPPCVVPSQDDPPQCPVPPGCAPPGPTDFRQPTSYCNLRNILVEHLPSQIEAGAPCEEMLFFFSSHGGEGYLNCVLTEDWGGKIWRPYLNQWLADLPCQKVTVILEACHSGRFIDILKEVPVSASLGQERVIFTSTTGDGFSLGDLDSGTDPNPGDIGSETIWGYIEAFGAGSADLPEINGIGDHEISFAEAVKYAVENDVSVLDQDPPNEPQVYPNPPPDFKPHSCYPSSSTVDLTLTTPFRPEILDAEPIAAIASPGAGAEYSVEVTVENLGPSALDVAILRIFIGRSLVRPRGFFPPKLPFPRPQEEGALWWPAEFDQIGNTTLFSDLRPGESTKFYLENFRAPWFSGDGKYTFVATVDGPRDPLLVSRVPSSVLLDIDNNAVGATIKVTAE